MKTSLPLLLATLLLAIAPLATAQAVLPQSEYELAGAVANGEALDPSQLAASAVASGAAAAAVGSGAATVVTTASNSYSDPIPGFTSTGTRANSRVVRYSSHVPYSSNEPLAEVLASPEQAKSAVPAGGAMRTHLMQTLRPAASSPVANLAQPAQVDAPAQDDNGAPSRSTLALAAAAAVLLFVTRRRSVIGG